MTAIIEFFQSLVDIITSLVGLVLNVIQSIFWLITNIGPMSAGIMTSFSYIPAFILPFATVSISLMVVFAILKLL